eukprot:6858850-Prymnesium_polylepis.1
MLAVMDAERVLRDAPGSATIEHTMSPVSPDGTADSLIKIIPTGPAFGEVVQDAAGRFEWVQSRNDIITVRVLHGLVDAPGKRLATLVN